MIGQSILVLIGILCATVSKLIAANGNKDDEEEAMMQAEEALKAARDRAKFGGVP